MSKNNLRKVLKYDELIKKYNKFDIPLPNRTATNIMNHPIISNLLFDDYGIDERHNDILRFDKSTQTPHEKGTQTDILEKGTQEDYKLQHHDLHPHLYYKIDAMSKTIPHDTNIIIKNDSISETVNTYDNINQTSNYIPNSLKQKTDNINQTVRYMLKDISKQDDTPDDYQDWYDSLKKQPTEVQEPENNPGLFNWLIRLALPDPQPTNQPDPPSVPPSVPSASIQSPSESPPESVIYNIPPSPPSSPSPVAYPASSSSSRSSGSMKSVKKQK